MKGVCWIRRYWRTTVRPVGWPGRTAIRWNRTTGNQEKKLMKQFVLTGLLMAGLGAGLTLATAQDAGQRRGFDPDQMRERMMDRLKTELKASDEEWGVMQPLLQNVMLKQREATSGRMGAMGMFAGQRGRPDAQPQPGAGRPGRQGIGPAGGTGELAELSEALESPNTSAAELKKRMAAVRAAREKAEAELKAAREELRQVLTLEQEARLVLMGVMD
jgi:hypothetical protein